MEKITPGDIVFGIDGKPCKVAFVHEILTNRNCYEILFDNGEKIIADEDHLWFTQSRQERAKKLPGTKKTTKQILQTLLASSKKEPNHRIPVCINGIKTKTNHLPIDPYVLGLWLGDGCSSSGSITAGKRDFTDIINILKTKQQQFDKILLHEYKSNIFTIGITVSKKVKTHSLCTLIKTNNLYKNKHIPNIYLRSSREQRLSLLQGLMDSDGYIDEKGGAYFYNTNIKLTLQVQELIESLGYKTSFKTFIPKLRGVECSKVGVVSFTPREHVCLLPFKQNRINRKRLQNNNSKLRAQWHYIKSIKPVTSVPVRCITVDNDSGTFLCGKQFIPTSNSTLMTIYSLWNACFNDDQRILLVANKEQTAKNIFKRVRLAYEQLPNYLKPGVIEYGQTSMMLSNGSSIGISTTSSDAGRGESVNITILDELAFIDSHIVEKFWESVYPIISSSKKSKIFIASTPNGTDNLFYRLYQGALQGDNNWKAERIDWWEIPGRDEKWKADTVRTLGSQEIFDQEFGNQFLQGGESSVDENLYNKMQRDIREPDLIFDENRYVVFDEPKENRLYTVGVDISEGIGQAASVIQVLDITDLTSIEQVAVFHDREIVPFQLTAKLLEILNQWGRPPVLIERNSCGAQVVEQLKLTHGYENVVSWGAKAGDKTEYKRIGILSHTNTKYRGVMNMRYWVNELQAVKIRDKNTLHELKNFIRYPNNTWAARPGSNSWDDRVMSLVWALMILENEICTRYFDVVKLDECSRPLIIKQLDYGIRGVVSPLSLYTNEKNEGNNVLPTFLESEKIGSEIDELKQQGWRFPGEDENRINNPWQPL